MTLVETVLKRKDNSNERFRYPVETLQRTSRRAYIWVSERSISISHVRSCQLWVWKRWKRSWMRKKAINWWDIRVNEESGEGGGGKFPRLSPSPPLPSPRKGHEKVTYKGWEVSEWENKKGHHLWKDVECLVSARAQHLQTRPLGALTESQHEKITAAQPGLRCSRVPTNTVILSFILV